MKLMPSGIFGRLVIALSLLVAISLGALGFTILTLARKNLVTSLESSQARLARSLARSLTDFQSDLAMGLAFALNLEKNPQMDWAEMNKLFLGVLASRSSFRSISLVEENGEVSVSAGELPSEIELEWLANVRKLGRPQKRMVSGRPFLAVVYPLTHSRRFVHADVSLEALFENMKKERAEDPALTHTEIVVLEREKAIFKTGETSPEVLERFRESVSPAAMRLQEREVVGSLISVAGAPWQVFVFEKVETALLPVRKMTATAVGFMLLGILAALAIAWGMARGISQPVQTLTAAAERISRGNYSTPVAAASPREIAILAETFNSMQKRILESQTKLITAERLSTIGQMAAFIGHEIRNPLAAIQNAAYFIKHKIEATPEIAKHLSIMENEIALTHRIANDLLSFARQRELTLGPCDVNAILEEACAATPAPEGVQVQKSLGNLPILQADKDQIQEVFTNLITNAYQAMTAKGVSRGSLTIGTHATREEAIVRFQDTGPGVSPENREKLFTAFFSTKAGGTGLGLVLVKNILEKHGGGISAESAPGQGAVFTVRVPIR